MPQQMASVIIDIEEMFGITINAPEGVAFITVGGLCEYVCRAVDETFRLSKGALTSSEIVTTTHHVIHAVHGDADIVMADSELHTLFAWRFQRKQLIRALEKEFRIRIDNPTPGLATGMVFLSVLLLEIVLLLAVTARWRDMDALELVFALGGVVLVGLTSLEGLNYLCGGVLRDFPKAVRTIGELTLLVRNALMREGRAEPNSTAITWGVRAVLSGYTHIPFDEITRDKRLLEDLRLD